MHHPPYCTCVQCSRTRLAQTLSPDPAPSNQTRQERTQSYLEGVCSALGIKVPLLIFSDSLQNAGACGEAGQSTIWLQNKAIEKLPWGKVKEIVLHELAHVIVHNTPGMGDVPAHGREFNDALRSIKSHPNIRSSLNIFARIKQIFA